LAPRVGVVTGDIGAVIVGATVGGVVVGANVGVTIGGVVVGANVGVIVGHSDWQLPTPQ